jgi:hypothetical protein
VEVNKRYLSRKEQQLQERRKNVEELLAWRSRLEQEEQLVRQLEEEALHYSSPATVSPSLATTNHMMDADFNAPAEEIPVEEEDTEIPDEDEVQPEKDDVSSIPEEVPTQKDENTVRACSEFTALLKTNCG